MITQSPPLGDLGSLSLVFTEVTLTSVLASIGLITLAAMLWDLSTEILKYLLETHHPHLLAMFNRLYRELAVVGIISIVLWFIGLGGVSHSTTVLFEMLHVALFGVAIFNVALVLLSSESQQHHSLSSIGYQADLNGNLSLAGLSIFLFRRWAYFEKHIAKSRSELKEEEEHERESNDSTTSNSSWWKDIALFPMRRVRRIWTMERLYYLV